MTYFPASQTLRCTQITCGLIFLFWFRRSGWGPRSQGSQVMPMLLVLTGHYSSFCLSSQFYFCLDSAALPSSAVSVQPLGPWPLGWRQCSGHLPVSILIIFIHSILDGACSLRTSSSSTILYSCFLFQRSFGKAQLCHIDS